MWTILCFLNFLVQSCRRCRSFRFLLFSSLWKKRIWCATTNKAVSSSHSFIILYFLRRPQVKALTEETIACLLFLLDLQTITPQGLKASRFLKPLSHLSRSLWEVRFWPFQVLMLIKFYLNSSMERILQA